MNNINKDIEGAFCAIVLTNLDKLYRFAFHLTANREDAEDLVHDLVVKLQAHQGDVVSADNPRTWLCRVLYNLHVDQKRKANRCARGIPIHQDSDVYELESLLPAENDAFHDPSVLLEIDRLNGNVFNALERMQQHYKEMILMHDVEGYSISELEYIMKTPTNTLKSRLRRARALLRNLLAKKEFGAYDSQEEVTL